MATGWGGVKLGVVRAHPVDGVVQPVPSAPRNTVK